MKYGFFRIGACSPSLRVADPVFNAKEILTHIENADQQQVGLLVFPELSLTGYTCGDLFYSKKLQEETLDSLFQLVEKSKLLSPIYIVGLPLSHLNKLYNCAAVIHAGKIYGFVPKVNLPNSSEFYERRHFSPGPKNGRILIRGQEYPFGTNQIFLAPSCPEFRLSVEICEDLWVPEPPSAKHAIMGATVIANLSASDEIVMKESYRRMLVSSQSARLIASYVYADAGLGESTSDMVFAGHNLLAENGRILSESKLFSTGLIYTDTDLELLQQERMHQATYPDQPDLSGRDTYMFHSIPFQGKLDNLCRDIPKLPFVPSDTRERERRCEEILMIQASGLAKRLMHTGIKKVLIGMSGGLDSTLAAIVCTRAFQLLNLPADGIIAVTMPGFGTTSRTYENAKDLARSFGATLLEIPISDAVNLHFRDIGHDPDVLDVTYENSQARTNTDSDGSCQ